MFCHRKIHRGEFLFDFVSNNVISSGSLTKEPFTNDITTEGGGGVVTKSDEIGWE